MRYIRNGYLVKFLKSFAFIPTLLITFIFLTFLLGAESYGILDSFTANEFSYCIIGCSAFFITLYVIYAFSSAKSKKINVADCVNFAILLTSIIYLLYTLIISKNYSLFRFLIPSVLIIVMAFITFIRTIYYEPHQENGTIYYTSHSLNGYYHILFKRHSFFGILTFSLLLTCLSFLIITRQYVFKLTSPNVVIPIIVGLFILSLAIYNSISKKIGFLDAGLFGLTVALIPALLQVLLLSSTKDVKITYLIYWSIFAGISIALNVLRFVFFDPSTIGKSTAEDFGGNVGLIDYIRKVSYKYGFGIVLVVSFVAIMLFVLIISFANVNSFYRFNEAGKLSIHFNIIPTLIINLLFVGGIVLGVFTSVSNVKSKKITFGDFLALVDLVFSVIAVLILTYKKTFDFRFYLLIILFAYSVILTCIRIAKVCPKKID